MAERIRYATQEQIDSFLQAARINVRDHALFTVMYWRGLRASEARLLRLTDYRRKEKRLYVRRVKNGISGEYPLSQDEVRAINAWLDLRGDWDGPLFASRQGAISRRRVHELVREYASRAGWPIDISFPHVLRHSIAVHLVERGVDLLAIKDWLGHNSINSTTVYARLTNRARDAVAASVYSDNRGRIEWSKVQRGPKP